MNRAAHYRWSELAEERPMDRVRRRRVMGEKAMVARVVLDKGFEVPTHAHENEQIAVVLSGKVRFGIGPEGSEEYEELVVQEGEVLHLPSMVPHSARALEDSVVLDVFSPPSETTGIDRVERS